MSYYGIKETEEALIGIMKLGLMFWQSFHDGFQISDIGDMWETYQNDPEFGDALKKAFTGYQKIPSEIKDLQVDEIIKLSGVLMAFLPKYLEVVRG